MNLLNRVTSVPFSCSIIRQCNHLTKYSPLSMSVPCRQQSALPPLKCEKIDSHIQLSTIQEEYHSPRPLILLFGWLLAKQRHLNKYTNLYHSQGCDVLTLQVQPNQVLIPKRAQRTVETLLALLGDSSLNEKPLLIHGFSVGGYVHGETMIKLSQQKERYKDIRDRMVGQIFDSPVDLQGLPKGVAAVLVKNKVGQSVIKSSLEGYLNLFKGPITSHYIKCSRAFHENEMGLPSLMLYSKTDPIGEPERIELAINTWRKKNIKVYSRCWESSPHVSHFHRHPDEYVEAVLAFLKSIGLTKSDHKAFKKVQAL